MSLSWRVFEAPENDPTVGLKTWRGQLELRGTWSWRPCWLVHSAHEGVVDRFCEEAGAYLLDWISGETHEERWLQANSQADALRAQAEWLLEVHFAKYPEDDGRIHLDDEIPF